MTSSTIYVGSDHRGFELKNNMMKKLSKIYKIVDCGNSVLDLQDDYVFYAQSVAKKVLQDKNSLGIVFCGSGVGVSIAANRLKGIRCGLGFSIDQVAHAKSHDHINMLAIPAEDIAPTISISMIETFIKTPPLMDPKYIRRIKALDSL